MNIKHSGKEHEQWIAYRFIQVERKREKSYQQRNQNELLPGVDQHGGMHALAVPQYFTRSTANHIVHIRDGHTALRGVRGDNDLYLVRGGGGKSEQLCLVRDVRVHCLHHRLRSVCGECMVKLVTFMNSFNF